jgi:FKBP-type peptidyl-prolyl cis-trans isomerase (trigger factor)
MRYIMKNSEGSVLANTLQEQPVEFRYGSGEILPGLEGPLTGLKIGEQKTFSLSPESVPGLNQTFYFDVIIDDVRWPSETEAQEVKDNLLKPEQKDCGPGCDC